MGNLTNVKELATDIMQTMLSLLFAVAPEKVFRGLCEAVVTLAMENNSLEAQNAALRGRVAALEEELNESDEYVNTLETQVSVLQAAIAEAARPETLCVEPGPFDTEFAFSVDEDSTTVHEGALGDAQQATQDEVEALIASIRSTFAEFYGPEDASELRIVFV